MLYTKVNYSKLVSDSIEKAKFRETRNFRRVHISKLFCCIYKKHPEFIKGLYLELFHSYKGVVERNQKYGINNAYSCQLNRLCKRMNEKYNIQVYGHWEQFRGYVLDSGDVKTFLPIAIADEFLGV